MKGFENFQLAMLNAAQAHIEPTFKVNRKALGEALWNHIFDLTGPQQINRELSRQDIYFGKVFRGFLEISASLDTLDEIGFYIGRFPYKNTRISEERYLQFHVESYFAEVFVLQERLTGYISFIRHQYKKDPRLQEFQTRSKALLMSIKASFQKPVGVRHGHIHEVRFSDPLQYA